MERVKWCEKCGCPVHDVMEHIRADHGDEGIAGADGYLRFEEKWIFESSVVHI